MKKSLFIIAMSLVATIGFAQGNSWNDKVNQWNAGIVIGYGTEISKPSFGIRGVYDIVNAFSVAGSFNYYLKDSEKAEVTVEAVNIELVRSIKPIKIIAQNVVYKENNGHMQVSAPKVAVSFSIRALLQGVIAPSSVEVNNPAVYIFTDYGIKDKTAVSEVSRKQLDYYIGWLEEFLERFNSQDRKYAESYINDIELNKVINEINLATNARCAMYEFQDLIPIGKEGRINFPSTLSNDNWSYRITKELFENKKGEIIEFFKKNIAKYNRN